jgi:hypothetical protein
MDAQERVLDQPLFGGGAPLTGAPAEDARSARQGEASEASKQEEGGFDPGSCEGATFGGSAEEEAYAELRQVWTRPWPDDAADDRRAFEAACRRADPEDILDGARAWTAVVEPRFLPVLAKWLAGDSWTKPPPQRKRQTAHHSNGHRVDLARLTLLQGGYVETEDGRLVWGGEE